MTATYEHSINHAAQLTREWVVDLSRQLDWDDRQRAWHLLRVSLQALRDWLGVDEAVQLGAQLPVLVRGIYYEGWKPSRAPVGDHGKDAFLARIRDGFSHEPLADPEAAVCAVFRFLGNRVSRGEIDDVRMRLPKALRELWPEARP